MNHRETDFLMTKVRQPRLPQFIVQRRRLLEHLDRGSTGRLTLLSAPAGYGKSSLIIHWADGHDIPRAWVRLDGRDNDPARFLLIMLTALAHVSEDLTRGLHRRIHTSEPVEIDAIITNLLNQIDMWGEELILIFDDFHTITSAEIHLIIERILDQSPPNLHMILATRTDPPIHLAGLRARGSCLEIRAQDLRFTLDEASVFIRQRLQLDMSFENLQRLYQQTEGWAAGLLLAGISLTGKEDQANFLEEFSGRNIHIRDYLLQEVLADLPDGDREFLSMTSLLGTFNASLCRTVTRRSDAGEVLQRFTGSNYFLEMLDDKGDWYRYHGLLAEYLAHHFSSDHPDRAIEVHRRAAAWHQAQGDILRAVPHLQKAGDSKQLLEMLEKEAGVFSNRGEYRGLVRALDGIPQHEILDHTLLACHLARALTFSGRFSMAQGLLDALATDRQAVALHNPDQLDNGHAGMIATVKASLELVNGNLPGARAQAERALQLLPHNQVGWRGTAALRLGDTLTIEGSTLEANQAYQKTLNTAVLARDDHLMMLTLFKMAKNLLLHGDLVEAENICRRGIAIADRSGLDQTPSLGMFLVLQAIIACERSQLDQAGSLEKSGALLATQDRQLAAVAWTALARTRIRLAAGDLEGAEALLDEVEAAALVQDKTFWLTGAIAAWRMRVWLKQAAYDDEILHAAFRYQDQFQPPTGADPDSTMSLLNMLSWSRLSIVRASAQHQPHFLEDAFFWIDRIERRCASFDWHAKVLEALILRASASMAHESTPLAMDALRKALRLGKSIGHRQLFLDEGQKLSSLIQLAGQRGIEPEFCGELLAAFSAQHQKPITTQPAIESLSQRELEVLALLAEGYTNQEVADRLVVSINTIRSHTKNIYGKLEAVNRTQAINRARSLGFLSTN